MEAKGWRSGDACFWGKQYGVVTIIIADEAALVVLDDFDQVVVPLDQLVRPAVEPVAPNSLKPKKGAR